MKHAIKKEDKRMTDKEKEVTKFLCMLLNIHSEKISKVELQSFHCTVLNRKDFIP